MHSLKRFFVVLTLALLAAGCTNTPSTGNMQLPAVDRDKAFDRNQDKISNLSSWQFDGRFSVRHPNGTDNANLSWLQEEHNYLLKISGPLQQGTIFIRGNGQTISYKDSKGVVDTAKTPEELLARHTNYELPLSSLRYWILGRPDPRYAYHLNIAPNGDLRSMLQQGWQLHYENFKDSKPYRLPTKITLKNSDVSIVISIHEWNPDLSAG